MNQFDDGVLQEVIVDYERLRNFTYDYTPTFEQSSELIQLMILRELRSLRGDINHLTGRVEEVSRDLR